MPTQEDQDLKQVARTWVAERLISLEEFPTELDEGSTITGRSETGNIWVVDTRPDGSWAGKGVKLLELDKWIEINSRWQGKLIRGDAGFELMVRRRLQSLQPEEYEQLRELLASL